MSTVPRTSQRPKRGSIAPLPTFAVIGVPKGGTTSLALWLAAHPSVFMAPDKELYYFGFNFDRSLDWYRTHFAGAKQEQAVGEATPWYLYSPEAPAQMASVLPDAKLIAILRNPIDRAYSHFWMQRWKMPAGQGFEEMVTQRLADPSGSNGPIRFLELGMYRQQLERFLEHYARESLMVLLFEDLVTDPHGTFAEVCRFIGVDDADPPDVVGKTFNPGGLRRSEGVHRVMKGFDAWRRAPRLARAVHQLNRKTTSYPPLDPEVRRRLSDYYAEPNAALGRWLDRDLSSWSA